MSLSGRAAWPPLVCLAVVTSALAVPPRSPLGDVGGHFGLHGPTYSHMLHDRREHLWLEGEALLNTLADTGAGWARQDFWWSVVEPEPGRFAWSEFDRAIAAYQRHDLHVYAILCYASAWSDGRCPDTDAERARFADYVYRMVKRYRGKVTAWEIWNEPNIQPFWSPRPSPELYAKLLVAAYEAAKRADPDCVVVGGALAGADAEFLAGMYAGGAGGHFDILSYHNYAQNASMETEWEGVAGLRAVMDLHGDSHKAIWQTETGFYTGPVGIPEDRQGAWIVRHSIGLLALGVEKVFQLTLHDWTDDPEHHDLSCYRGLTHADFRRKPSYDAFATMCRRLNDKRLVGALRPAPGIQAFLFRSEAAGGTVLVMWRDGQGPAERFRLNLGAPVILVQQANGDTMRQRSVDGSYSLLIGFDPIYVFNPGPEVTRQTLVQWSNPVCSRLPRSANATIRVTVSNPTKWRLQFVMRDDARVSSPSNSGHLIPAGRTIVLDYPIDTSRMTVGHHDLAWELREAPAGNRVPGPVAVGGYRRVEIAAPLNLSFGVLRRLTASAPELPVEVEFHATEPTSASLALQIQNRPVAVARTLHLQPGKSLQVSVPLDLTSFEDGRRTRLGLRLQAGDLAIGASTTKALLRCPAAPPEARVDGDLGEWSELEPLITPRMMRWEYVNAKETPAAEDLQVTGWVAHDERGLWVALRVNDDVLHFPKSRATWNWDSLQVALDMGSDARPGQRFDGNDLEIELGLNPQGKPWCYLGYCPAGWPEEQLSAMLTGEVKADPIKREVVYELLIPASLLVSSTELRRDTVMGFSIMVNDNDGTGRAGWQELTPGIGVGKHPADYDWLWLR